MVPISPWSLLTRAPLLRVMLPVIAGMASAMVVSVPLAIGLWVFAGATLLMALVLLKRIPYGARWRRGIWFGLWCFLFGAAWATLADPTRSALHVGHDPEGEAVWCMRVNALNGLSDALVRADATVIARRTDEGWHPRTGRVLLSLLRGEDAAVLAPGEEIIVRAALEPIDRVPDPGGFDRTGWARVRGLALEVFAPRSDWYATGRYHRHWTGPFADMREQVSQWLVESGLPPRERAVVKALALGLRDDLGRDQKDAFVRSGTIHILAVSGTHVGIIYVMLSFMVGWWGAGHRARILRGALVLLALWAYAGLTGAAPSVLRATVMFSLFTLADMFARRSDSLNNLFAAALVLLLWEPRMLLELGFQLSFLAVLGIVLFYRPMLSLWSPGPWVLRQLWSLCALSITAQLFTTPLSLFMFKAFPIWFLPANLVVVTAAAAAVYLAVALLLFHRVPWLGDALTWLLTELIRLVGAITGFFADAPGAYPSVRFGWPEMLLCYTVVAALVMRWLWRWRPGTSLGVWATACLLVVFAWRTHASHHRSSFTVYDDRRTLQVGMVSGRGFVLLADPGDLARDGWLQRKAERHRQAVGLDAPGFLAPADLQAPVVQRSGAGFAGGGRWCVPGIDALFIGPDGGFPVASARPAPDVVVMHGLVRVDSTALAAMPRPAHVVLAGDNHWRVRRTVRAWCGSHGIACHDVRDDGAFILER